MQTNKKKIRKRKCNNISLTFDPLYFWRLQAKVGHRQNPNCYKQRKKNQEEKRS